MKYLGRIEDYQGPLTVKRISVDDSLPVDSWRVVADGPHATLVVCASDLEKAKALAPNAEVT